MTSRETSLLADCVTRATAIRIIWDTRNFFDDLNCSIAGIIVCI